MQQLRCTRSSETKCLYKSAKFRNYEKNHINTVSTIYFLKSAINVYSYELVCLYDIYCTS